MEIKTKYDIGNEVWIMIAGECYCFRVVEIRIIYSKKCKFINYTVLEDGEDLGFTFRESDLYYTKEDLLNSLHVGSGDGKNND